MRGAAVVMMVVYHLMWDLWFFQILSDEQFWNPFWKYWQRTTASTFLILVGVSLTLTYRRLPAPSYAVFLRRGLRIFGLGLVITLVMTFSGIGVIDFGILHLIGFSILVAYPLLRHTWLNLWLWLLFFVVGGWCKVSIGQVRGRSALLTVQHGPIWIDGRWLAPVGNVPPGYAAVDFFPIFPWFGVVLLGRLAGQLVLHWPRTALLRVPEWGHLPRLKFLEVVRAQLMAHVSGRTSRC